ncbi:MAG: alpha/beta hydrolase [Verrucomicrobiae bacterium]|nr:alpha/beta hydrolase [Verrucomicrobiae bacterium]
MRSSPRLLARASLFAALVASAPLTAQDSTPRPQGRPPAIEARLRDALERFPQADANKDGTLTMEEGLAFLALRKGPRSGTGDANPAGAEGPAPTLSDIAYGPHDRNRLDFWRAKADGPAPLVVFIHGGGFVGGDKSKWRGSGALRSMLDAGLACAAINYRFRDAAPIQDILRDSARAVQFLRSKAPEWNIDKGRVAGWGGSAGAGTSLWLATRDDLARPDGDDPVLRESSRLQAAVLQATQATYNLPRWESFVGPPKPEWLNGPNELIEFYHMKSREELDSPRGRAILDDCDMLRWIGPGDAPVFIMVNQPDGEPKSRGHWLHHPKHAEEIKKACDAAGVPCTISRGDADQDPAKFLLECLNRKS